MSDYGYGVWVDIVRAALNGGQCDCRCEEEAFGDAPGEFAPGEETYSGRALRGEGNRVAGEAKLAAAGEREGGKCKCT